MPTIRVPTDQPTIAAAMLVAAPGDTIALDSDYTSESASVTVDGLTFTGDFSNTSIALTMAGAIAGLTLDGGAPFEVVGNGSTNSIVGNGASNRLNGAGGADVMRGLGGNDIYTVDNLEDVVDEAAIGSTGTDAVRSSVVSIDLGDGARFMGAIEWIILDGSANLDATGNSGANAITGNSGANRVDGGGNADVMRGMGGDDTYVVDHGGDIVDEAFAGSSGTDTVVSSTISINLSIATRYLGAIERVQLDGAADLNATGNALDNLITGNAGSNILNGGIGADTLRGFAGNDRYVVDSLADFVDETGGSGTDTVRSSTVSIDLTDASRFQGSIEQVILDGGADLDVVGNSLGNAIVGNSGANSIDGGAGVDIMRGMGGDDVYTINNLLEIVDEGFAGSGGDDTIRSSVVSVDLTNTVRYLGQIENIILDGSLNLTATGNALDNEITGNAGNNTIRGGQGADAMDGGDGVDTAVYTHFVALVSLATGTSSEGDTLVNIENLTGSDSGILEGDGGANTLQDGGTMRGLGGDDTYIFDGSEIIDEMAAGSGGIDTIRAFADVNLADFARFKGEIENVQLISGQNATGNGLANTLTGNSSGNRIDGGGGADLLIGGGGYNDRFIIDNVGDVVDATGGQLDTVRSAVISIDLTDTVHFIGQIEQIILDGSANLNATGNSLGNVIVGNSGDNIINGWAGNNQMFGGAGNDTYIIHESGDRVDEAALGGSGIDTVRSSVVLVNLEASSFEGPNFRGDVENIILDGAANLAAYGNSLDNHITGNSGDNFLSGRAGADTMVGLGGDDTYHIDNAGDIADESGGSGFDTVLSSTMSIDLSGMAQLIGSFEGIRLEGSANLNATGNGLDNLLRIANTGSNVLAGGGGADTFFFLNNQLAQGNADTISDYSVADDVIHLQNGNGFGTFAALPDGWLDGSAFVLGTAATTANHRLIYDGATGQLFYDADGTGVASQQLFLQLSAGLAMGAGEFFVV